MPKYRVTVKVIATCSETFELEADKESQVENDAIQEMEANHLPEDFQVDAGYCTYEVEHEQLTAICPSCDTEHALPTWDTRLCHCGAIGVRPGEFWPGHPEEPVTIPHLIVDGVCTPAPWWEWDQDYCRPCGLQQPQP